MVEVLKVLFNLALESRTEDTEELTRICKTLDSVLNHAYEDKDSENMVVSNVINFLTNMDGKMEPTSYIIHKISNIQRILDYLLMKLEEYSENKLKNLKVRGLLNTVAYRTLGLNDLLTITLTLTPEGGGEINIA